MGSPQQAYNQILQMAREGKLSDDPALVQSLIPGVAFMNQDLMTELGRTDANQGSGNLPTARGVQMQLKMLVG